MQNSMTQAIQSRFEALVPFLDERTRRLWAAVKARVIGRGGITRVAEATGLSQTTIQAGLQELDARNTSGPHTMPHERVRRPGGGRKSLVEYDPHLLKALEALVDPVTRGDPMGPLCWTCKSAARLATELENQGYAVSERSIN